MCDRGDQPELVCKSLVSLAPGLIVCKTTMPNLSERSTIHCTNFDFIICISPNQVQFEMSLLVIVMI